MTAEIHRRFVVVTDGHYNQGPQEFKDNHDLALNVIDDLHAEREVDFVVHTGDVVHDDETVHSTVITEFFDQLPTSKWFATFGNHDFSDSTEWQNDYGHPKQHTFEAGDYGCIITNTGQTDGGMKSADASFIEMEIDNFSSKEGIFVFQHIAPFTNTDQWGVDSPDVRAQFARPEVKAVFMGHAHPKNGLERNDGGWYFYSNRLGGSRLRDDIPDIEDWGIRLVDVYEDGTILTSQEPLNLDRPLNENTLPVPAFVHDGEGWVPVNARVAVPAGFTQNPDLTADAPDFSREGIRISKTPNEDAFLPQ